MVDRATTADRLRAWRTLQGLTQSEAAASACIPQDAWSRIERGERQPSRSQTYQIEILTGGRIKARDWLTADERRRIDRARRVPSVGPMPARPATGTEDD